MSPALPTLIPVQSKAIRAISPYDPVNKTFHIQFHSGAVYEYPGTEPYEYAAFEASDSLGRHLNTHFRDRGVLVEPEQQ
jgi:hypothetical protein